VRFYVPDKYEAMEIDESKLSKKDHRCFKLSPDDNQKLADLILQGYTIGSIAEATGVSKVFLYGLRRGLEVAKADQEKLCRSQ